jgi:hypothetical protein
MKRLYSSLNGTAADLLGPETPQSLITITTIPIEDVAYQASVHKNNYQHTVHLSEGKFDDETQSVEPGDLMWTPNQNASGRQQLPLATNSLQGHCFPFENRVMPDGTANPELTMGDLNRAWYENHTVLGASVGNVTFHDGRAQDGGQAVVASGGALPLRHTGPEPITARTMIMGRIPPALAQKALGQPVTTPYHYEFNPKYSIETYSFDPTNIKEDDIDGIISFAQLFSTMQSKKGLAEVLHFAIQICIQALFNKGAAGAAQELIDLTDAHITAVTPTQFEAIHVYNGKNSVPVPGGPDVIPPTSATALKLVEKMTEELKKPANKKKNLDVTMSFGFGCAMMMNQYASMSYGVALDSCGPGKLVKTMMFPSLRSPYAMI